MPVEAHCDCAANTPTELDLVWATFAAASRMQRCDSGRLPAGTSDRRIHHRGTRNTKPRSTFGCLTLPSSPVTRLPPASSVAHQSRCIRWWTPAPMRIPDRASDTEGLRFITTESIRSRPEMAPVEAGRAACVWSTPRHLSSAFRHGRYVWTTQCSNCFRAANARVVTQWPRSARSFWGMTRLFTPSDFIFCSRPRRPVFAHQAAATPEQR
jgi:hypothetical protein